MRSLFGDDGRLNKGISFDQEDVVVKEEPATDEHYSGKELYRMQQALGRKFEASDVAKDRKLANTAEWYTLDVYGDDRSHWSFNFMRQMQLELAHKGRLSNGQSKGVLNTMVAIVKEHAMKKREQREHQADEPDVAVGHTLANGYYTVVADNKHWTIRLQPAHWNKTEQVFGFLIGPDNTSQYANCGSVVDGKIQWWRQANFRGTRRAIPETWKTALEFLLGANEEQIGASQQMYAKRSGNCYVCGRTLTDPTSIELGIGPVCRQKGGM